jgi:parallel beta-helix repeat protein
MKSIYWKKYIERFISHEKYVYIINMGAFPMRNIIKITMVIGITMLLLTPLSMVIADDTEPPVITNVVYSPHAGVRTAPGFSMFQSCNVTDNVSVANVKINITGPVGFTPINDSMVNISANEYYYNVSNVSLSGTYAFYIWANDTSGNSVRSNTYYMLVFEDFLNYIYVDVNNTLGPWNGSSQYPLQYISDALAVIAQNGTIFLYHGIYSNTSISLDKSINFIGEDQSTTILDGGGVNNSIIIQISNASLLSISTLTLQNAANGLFAHDGGNTSVSHCTFTHCTESGISMFDYHNILVTNCTFLANLRGIAFSNCSYNQFYHNNFINNTIQVSSYFNNTNNSWDNGIMGSYWDTYRTLYPNAHVIPLTGTWDTPYLVNASGNNTDNHPWVYQNGFIDTVPPRVTVLYPNGGEVVFGELAIQWTAFDDLTLNLNGTIRIEYSPDNGSSWFEIASQQDNTGMYLWNTTIVPDGNKYLIRVNATDEFYNTGSDTSNATFSIGNHLPTAPQINGPSQGGGGIPFNFTAITFDPEGDQIYYKWDWGNGNITEWLGPFNSGIPITASYMWEVYGNYSVRVKAKDIGGGESNWSRTHNISIAPQVYFSNMQFGYLYINLFTFNLSYIYSEFLYGLRVVIIFTSHEMILKAFATDIVRKVAFQATNLLAPESMEIIDDNSSDGFYCTMNVSRGVYELNVTAYDVNGTLVDRYTLPVVVFLRIGRYALGPSQNPRHLIFGNRLRH